MLTPLSWALEALVHSDGRGVAPLEVSLLRVGLVTEGARTSRHGGLPQQERQIRQGALRCRVGQDFAAFLGADAQRRRHVAKVRLTVNERGQTTETNGPVENGLLVGNA